MQYPRSYTRRYLVNTLSNIYKYNSSDWKRAEKRHVKKLFIEAFNNVPAYRDFLQKRGIKDPNRYSYEEIIYDIPSINKKNYINKYKQESLMWGGDLSSPSVFTATSGSTGNPTYFLRSRGIDQESSLIHELFFNTSCNINKPTLVIVCFGMGIWIGGIITYRAFQQMADYGYPISIITPGINMQEILRALKELAPKYKQIILAGYPPFVKDVIDECNFNKIDLKNIEINFLFAAEPFTERFRKYIARVSGIKNPCKQTINIYGTADIGTMAFETPLSIIIRREAYNKKKLFKDLFGVTVHTPTLAQFIPTFTSFSEVDRELFITGDSATPFINYALGDRGGVYSFDTIKEICESHGLNLKKLIREEGIKNQTTNLPFVFVRERTDFSVSLYGLQIYPEPVRDVLLKTKWKNNLTGKCSLSIKNDKKQNQVLEINIELKKEIKMKHVDKNILLKEIILNLTEKNAEYKELTKHINKRAYPHLIFWENGHQKYFKTGIKQKWVV